MQLLPLKTTAIFDIPARAYSSLDHVNQYLTNGFSHRYQLGKSIFIFKGVMSDFFFNHSSMKFLCANRIAPDGTRRSAASNLGLYCLPMSHKRDARLI